MSSSASAMEKRLRELQKLNKSCFNCAALVRGRGDQHVHVKWQEHACMHACLNHLMSVVQSSSACRMAEGPCFVAWLLCHMAKDKFCPPFFDLPCPHCPSPLPSLQGTAYVLPAYGVFVCTECSGKQ